MNNIPLYTCENGVATLILREIPYSGEAYVILRTAEPGRETALAADCARFCRMAGAQRVYASGEGLEVLAQHCEILSMTCEKSQIPRGDGLLWPVLPENVETYRKYYNENMVGVPNAAAMAWTDEKRLIREGGAYFVHRDGQLLGLGQVREDRLEAVIALIPGAGATVLGALVQMIAGDTVNLQVASTNGRARRLYDRLGFLSTGIVSRWHEI